MRLWSFQSPQVYRLLQEGRPFQCDTALSDGVLHMGFQPAYEWLAGRMATLIGAPPAGVRLPVWAWHTWDWRHKRPDLRRAEFRYNEDMYLLELEVPDGGVMLSDEEAWHAVLNGSYLNPATNETEWEQLEAAFDGLPAKAQRQTLFKSWESIFDIAPYETPWTWKGRYVQATMWEIRPEQVKNFWLIKPWA